MERKYNIVDGPSKYDLQAALFDRRGNGNKPHTVTFKTEEGIKITAIILRVAAEDGSGESWLIKGFTDGVVMSHDFNAYYRTDKRSGHITEEPPKSYKTAVMI